MRRRGRWVALTVAVLLGGLPPPASAEWLVTGTGPVSTSAGQLPGAPVPTLSETTKQGSRQVTLTWPAPASGVPLTGWRVSRTGGTGELAGSCQGSTTWLGQTGVLPVESPSAQMTCTDVVELGSGVLRYAVTPLSGAWVGAASAWTSPSG